MTADVLKTLYRRLVPASIRRSQTVRIMKGRLLRHEWIYDKDYYRTTVEIPAARSAGTIADSIVREFAPRRVIDVGCGTGALLEALRRTGCEVAGLDYSNAALDYCRSRGLSVRKFDLERNAPPEETYDLAVSMEVAEHLPERVADSYVNTLIRLAPTVVFTAAPPGQGGIDHVNEQPASYWISKFVRHGFSHAADLSSLLQQRWQAAGDVESWYYSNLMIFHRRGLP